MKFVLLDCEIKEFESVALKKYNSLKEGF